MHKTGEQQPLPVAEVKPGDFPIGSMESRAAARMLASRKREASKEVIAIKFIPARDGHPDAEKMQNPPRLIRRSEGPDSIFEFWSWADADDERRVGLCSTNEDGPPRQEGTAG